MCPHGKPVKKTHRQSRSPDPPRVASVYGGVALLAMLPVCAALVLRHPHVLAESPVGAGASVGANILSRAASLGPAWHDSLGDGFPDGARLDSARDRENFIRWFTFLAETPYYSPSPRTRVEVEDCAALIRFAFRNSLEAHSPAWRENAGLPYDPGFGDIAKYNYPYGPLGRALFRARPGPAAPADLAAGSRHCVASHGLPGAHGHPISHLSYRRNRRGRL